MSTTEFKAVTEQSQPAAGLDEATSPKEVVRYLLETVRLTQRELEEVVRADTRTIRRWADKDSAAEPQERFHERIDDLRAIALMLGRSLPGEQTGRWLRARNRYLRWQRPLDLLAAGNYEEALEAIEAYLAGAAL